TGPQQHFHEHQGADHHHPDDCPGAVGSLDAVARGGLRCHTGSGKGRSESRVAGSGGHGTRAPTRFMIRGSRRSVAILEWEYRRRPRETFGCPAGPLAALPEPGSRYRGDEWPIFAIGARFAAIGIYRAIARLEMRGNRTGRELRPLRLPAYATE